MKINELNTMAQTLNRIGSQHLRTDGQGRMAPATSSLGGRIVHWIRSRHSDAAAQANRDVMNGIIDTIRQTEGLGNRFADMARRELGSKLASGRPLSGRDAARVMQDVIRIKTAEDAMRRLNAQSLHGHLCTADAVGNSPLAERLAAKRTLFGLGAATPEQLRAFQDATREDLLAAAHRADHSLSREEGLAVLDETARRLSLQEARGGIRAMSDRVTGDGPGGFTERLTAALQARGLSGEISATLREALTDKIHEKLVARCLYDKDNMHQPTLEEAGGVADSVIGGLADALETVQHSELPDSFKPVVQKTLLHASMPVTPGMAQAVCDAVVDTGLFLAELRRSDATPEDLQEGFQVYSDTLHRAITQPDGNLRPGIDGGPEAGETRRLTAQCACLLSGYDCLTPLNKEETLPNEQQPEERLTAAELAARKASRSAAEEAMHAIIRSGSPLHPMHYAMQQNPDPAVRTRSELMLMNLLEALNDATDGHYSLFLRPSGLGQMSMAQARQFVPAGTGLPEQDGQNFDFDKALRTMNEGIALSTNSTPPGSGISMARVGTSEGLARKLSAFSEEFLKDFYRNGVTVNGRLFGHGAGSDDPVAMEAALDELIAQFPSLEEAGRVCSPLHQALGADLLHALINDPLTSQRVTAYLSMGEKNLSDLLSIAVDTHAGGSYTVHAEFNSQKVSATIPGGSEGFNVAVDYSLPSGTPPLQFTATGFDLLFNVTRPE